MTTELIAAQIEGPRTNFPIPMETEVSAAPEMTALEKLKQELQSKRNLDTGFENADFNIDRAIQLILELDKYTKISVFNSWKFFLNMQSIRQAQRILPNEGIEKTAEGRDQYDHLIAHTMDEYEKEGDFVPTLPAFLALNEKLRVTMYEELLDPSTMTDTLEFMTKRKPVITDFEKDYEARLEAGQRPGVSKRVFCELQLEDAMKAHNNLIEHGQDAIQFCEDLHVHMDRGHGDLPEWAIDTLYNKMSDKLEHRWQKLDIRRTGLRTKPADRTEAEADQLLIEFVYKKLTGREFATEY